MNVENAYIEEIKKQAIIDREKAIKNWWHSCYWAWVEQWIIECCDKLLDYVNESYM